MPIQGHEAVKHVLVAALTFAVTYTYMRGASQSCEHYFPDRVAPGVSEDTTHEARSNTRQAYIRRLATLQKVGGLMCTASHNMFASNKACLIHASSHFRNVAMRMGCISPSLPPPDTACRSHACTCSAPHELRIQLRIAP